MVSLPAEQVEQLSMALLMLVALLRGAGGQARVHLAELGDFNDASEIVFEMSDDGHVLTARLRDDDESTDHEDQPEPEHAAQ